MDLVGRILGGRYRVVREIGRGGMARVFEAKTDTGPSVAIKVLHELDERAFARFRSEATALATFSDPNVVSVLDFRADDGEPPFMVMELLQGETLHAALARQRTLPAHRAIAIGTAILQGLEAAHRRGIWHRDMKPANVMLIGDKVKVLDFGIAKIRDGGGPTTTTGTVLGTPSYLAPEQITGGEIGPPADLHATGAILYEMLVGERPWPGPAAERMKAILASDAPSLRGRAGVSDRLAAVVARALAYRPEDRFASAAEMRNALAAAAPTRGRRIVFFASVAATTLLGGLALLLYPIPRREASVTRVGVVSSAIALDDTSSASIASSDATPRSARPNRCACSVFRGGRVVGMPLCPVPREPRCTCVSQGGSDMCAVPWTFDEAGTATCPPGVRSFGGAGKLTDQPCLGHTYLYDANRVPHDQPSESGLLRCEVCYRPVALVDGVQGAPCEGLVASGATMQGRFDCQAK